jgi:hypothetical protein
MASLVPALVVFALLAQSITMPPPAFSGSWTMDQARSGSVVGEPGELVIVSVTPDAMLRIEKKRGDQSEVITYTMEAAPETPGVIGAGTRRAYWDGMRLVTEGSGTVQGQTVSVREMRTLNAGGTEMTVETMVMVQHGYTFRGAQNYATGKDVYKRTSQ